MFEAVYRAKYGVVLDSQMIAVQIAQQSVLWCTSTGSHGL